MCPSEARIDGKVVLVTGANAGLGKETARDLALRGKLAGSGRFLSLIMS